MTLHGRASLIPIPSPRPRCRICQRLIEAKHKQKIYKCIALNLYSGTTWIDTQVQHLACWEENGSQFGPAIDKSKSKVSRYAFGAPK